MKLYECNICGWLSLDIEKMKGHFRKEHSDHYFMNHDVTTYQIEASRK